jgi:hypothetical protein
LYTSASNHVTAIGVPFVGYETKGVTIRFAAVILDAQKFAHKVAQFVSFIAVYTHGSQLC